MREEYDFSPSSKNPYLDRLQEPHTTEIKRYKAQYPISAYTFPDEARIHRVRFDDEYIHVTLTDGRVLSIPLWWIPTVYNASPKERERYEISRDRRMIIWDAGKCAINDELRIADYLSARGHSRRSEF
jgi:hypothetical protein